MNQREALIVKYAEDLRSKFDQVPDLDLLKKVTIGLGPSIYKRDASTVSSSELSEIKRIKDVFLINKLNIDADDEDLMDEALNNILATYGKTNRTKYRAVVYYLLVKHFGKEEVYN